MGSIEKMERGIGGEIMIQKILLLGEPELYKKSEPVKMEELLLIKELQQDLHDTMMEFRRVYHAGRAIAAPQIGSTKRVIYMNTGEPILFINPVLEFPDDSKMDIMDDCMSFPGLFVKVERYRRCIVHYKNIRWEDCKIEFEDDLSELIQHEYDHLDGILATMRAKDEKSFYMKKRQKCK